MNISPTEVERLLVFGAAEFARRNRRLGIKLSHPEAVALLTDEAMLLARRDVPYEDIRDRIGSLLGPDEVQPGVAAMIKKILVELPMAEGTKLLAIFDPVPAGDDRADGPPPGAVVSAADEVDTVDDTHAVHVEVFNRGDRDIQVRSHTHFFEVNRALRFDRAAAWGMKLALPSGSGVRFEPGIAKTVPLIPMSGSREVFGFAGLVNGSLDDGEVRANAFRLARERGYLEMGDANDFD